MNKDKPNCNKRILHYTEDNIPKHVQVQELPQPKDTAKIAEEVPKCQAIAVLNSVITSAPKKNSTLGMKKRLKKVEETKPRKVKSLSELPKAEKATADEKMTKKMNFLFDQKLYKELISLKLTEKPEIQPERNSYEPVLKDRVPNLEDFFKPTVKSEFNIPVPVQISPQTVYRKYNSLSTYQVMQTWGKS